MLQYYGMLGMPHSWGVVSQSILLELQRAGIELKCKSTNKADGVHPNLVPTIVPYDQLIQTEVSFSYTIPINLRKINAKHRIQIYNYETTILPAGWANVMNTDAHLILPSSNFSKEIFAENGVRPERMVVVPHGYDPLTFNPNVSPIQLSTSDQGKFKFLMVAAPHWRKGHDIMMRAFIEEFKNDKDVVLIIKSSMNSHEQQAHFHIDLNKIRINLLKTHKYEWPEIRLINQKVESLAGLYKYADALVLPTRAECFSLTPLEAAACKTPVITTDYGGHLDFLNSENSYLIDYVMRKCPAEGQYHQYQPAALIAEPNLEHLKQIMREVKNNYAQAQVKADLAYSQIVDKYTWASVGSQIIELIKERGWNV